MKPNTSIKEDPGTSPLPLYALEDGAERRNRRVALVVAVVFHALLLSVPLSQRTTEAEEVTKTHVVTVMNPPRFEKPKPPEPEKLRKPKAHKVPIPDPTPDEPEPLRVEETLETDPVFDDDVFIEFPTEAPPEVPSSPVRVGMGVDPPERIHYVHPRYTEIARRARIEGIVILDATIDAEGNVVNVQVLKPLPMGLDQSAVEAAKQWRYEPATLNGKPVPVYYTVSVSFQLN